MNETGHISSRARENLIRILKKQGIKSLSVLQAIKNTPRHKFIEEALRHRAYDNDALPIGNSQTISQPYIVARMTEALLAGGQVKKVLEVGTGSGYQAAVLSRLVEKIYSIERISKMSPIAGQRLADIGIKNVQLKHGDGNKGWVEHAPFDAILVTAASVGVPTKLYEQLIMGGRMIIPIGAESDVQDLVEVLKTEEGHKYKFIEKVRFVPMRAGQV